MLTDLRTWLVIAVVLLHSGCGTLYVAQAARGQWQVMSARRPIAQVIADPAVSEELKARLVELQAARMFAVTDLGLPDNKSYRSYADVERDYVVWNVVAAPEFSVEPREWCFPVAGCVAYRGYFAEHKAREFAARLEDEGDDVVVMGVPAYSTLGRFADPILNTMLRYGDDELAGIVFHELAHQIVYVPGDSVFNEAFAVTVEQAGLARWLAHQGRALDAAKFRARLALNARVVAIVTRYRALLAELYQRRLPDDDKRAHKRELFARLVSEIATVQSAAGVTSQFARDLAAAPNNARLASLATYYVCVPGFERVLAQVGHDLPAFYRAVRAHAALSEAERHAALCTDELAAGAPPGGIEP